jgi:DNA modification methylase
MAVDIEDKGLDTVWVFPHGGAAVDDRIPRFPVELVIRLMLLSTVAGDRVLDPFGGAGTVGVAAGRLDRKCTLIEVNPEFAEIARVRIAEDDPEPVVFDQIKR